jgi:methionine-rich copper-binding protein CopC
MARSGPRFLLMTGLLVGLTAAVLSAPPPGRAAMSLHAGINSTKPANGSVIKSSPPRIVLHFTEAVSVQSLTLLELSPASGAVVEIPSRMQTRGTELIVRPERPVKGGVTVAWSVISDDGHPVDGAVTFWVGALPSIRRTMPLLTTPAVPASIDGDTLGLRTVRYRRAVEAGSVSWSHPLLPGPLITPLIPAGRAAQSTALLTLPGTWQLVTTLLGTDGSVVVVQSAVTIQR